VALRTAALAASLLAFREDEEEEINDVAVAAERPPGLGLLDTELFKCTFTPPARPPADAVTGIDLSMPTDAIAARPPADGSVRIVRSIEVTARGASRLSMSRPSCM